MTRREFMATGSLAGLAPLQSMAQPHPVGEAQFLELRHYLSPYGDGRKRLLDFFDRVAIPAWNRLDVGPVGVFSVLYGPNNSSVYVLLPHKSLASVLDAENHMLSDSAFLKAGEAFYSLPSKDPGYRRIETSLLKCFSHMPQIHVPNTAASRLFEWRIYESHHELKAKKKIEMFNEGGEIDLFQKCGFVPVFFAETLIGPNRPNLNYMLVFSDMTERDKTWAVFRNHPDWLALKEKPEYADTVCTITDIILQPVNFSQI